MGWRTAQWLENKILDQVSPDRAVLKDDDREMCPACGEFPAVYVGGYCRRCEASIEEDRLNRGE